jgi:hypothetical protein
VEAIFDKGVAKFDDNFEIRQTFQVGLVFLLSKFLKNRFLLSRSVSFEQLRIEPYSLILCGNRSTSSKVHNNFNADNGRH